MGSIMSSHEEFVLLEFLLHLLGVLLQGLEVIV